MNRQNPQEEREHLYKTQTMFYCRSCLSLKIIAGKIVDYCDECGSAEIEEATLEEYDKLYYKKYGKTYFKH